MGANRIRKPGQLPDQKIPRARWRISTACGPSVLTGTNRILGWVTAVQITFASFVGLRIRGWNDPPDRSRTPLITAATVLLTVGLPCLTKGLT